MKHLENNENSMRYYSQYLVQNNNLLKYVEFWMQLVDLHCTVYYGLLQN